jgi:hypothetical protein
MRNFVLTKKYTTLKKSTMSSIRKCRSLDTATGVDSEVVVTSEGLISKWCTRKSLVAK